MTGVSSEPSSYPGPTFMAEAASPTFPTTSSATSPTATSTLPARHRSPALP
jgi:hypothetical protein